MEEKSKQKLQTQTVVSLTEQRDKTVISVSDTVHSDKQQSTELKPAAVIDDKYEVLSSLGSGGMSAVYLVKHILLKEFLLSRLFIRTL